MNWLSFLTYALVTAITPGPNTIMSLANGTRKGFKRALPFNFGIWLGFSVVMLLCTVFMSALARFLPQVRTPMLFLGAAYLLYLAYKTYTAPAGVREGRRAAGGFFSGMLLQFINPKLYVYALISMDAFVLPHYAGEPLMLFWFALLLAFIGFACTLLWSAFGSVFRKLFSEHAHITNTVMALLLVYCAVSLFF